MVHYVVDRQSQHYFVEQHNNIYDCTIRWHGRYPKWDDTPSLYRQKNVAFWRVRCSTLRWVTNFVGVAVILCPCIDRLVSRPNSVSLRPNGAYWLMLHSDRGVTATETRRGVCGGELLDVTASIANALPRLTGWLINQRCWMFSPHTVHRPLSHNAQTHSSLVGERVSSLRRITRMTIIILKNC